MTNFEFYKEKILKLVDNNEGFALTNDIIVSCDDIFCGNCAFNDTDCICDNEKIKWLYEEYIPPKPKLTKRERGFCEAVESGWLARDSNGTLYLYKEKPLKHSDDWGDNIIEWSNLNPSFYPSFDFLKWEDDEPYAVEEMLTWEVEE